jgi:hypothetical protein
LGTLAVTPDYGAVGEWGTWTVRYTAGPAGVATGGSVRVALPLTWHGWWRNSARALQATRPADPFYVSARSSQTGVRLRCVVEGETPPHPSVDEVFVKNARPYLDGNDRRYGWVVRVSVDEGQLAAGDAIDVLYGDRSGGSRGFTPPIWGRSPELVRAEVDVTGSGTHVPLPEDSLPRLRVEPGPPTEVAVRVPSVGVVGEPVEAIVAPLDANLNPSWPRDLEVTVRVVEGSADLLPLASAHPHPPPTPRAPGLPQGEGTVTLGYPGPDAWSARVRLVPRAPGIVRLRAQSGDGRLFAVSNPCRCEAAPPAERLYWGDLHGHTQFSWDATGLPEDAFRYARDVSGLEVYGNADHGESLSAADWEATQALNARYHEPGRFVTLVGYEDSLRFPYGHHNVFFRGATGPLRHSRMMSLEQLWEVTTPGEALTIPHHPVALGNPSRPNTNWEAYHPQFQAVAEIYSGHGQSEVHADDHPLASDVVDFTLTGPAAPPSSVQEGWLMGRHFGIIASSDNHFARPGREGFGVMAVYAPELTREAVFDAIRHRRTYGTTGCRLLLDFALNGTPMGGEVRLEPGQPARIVGHVVGAAPIRFVEILRGDLEAKEWRVAHREWFAGNAPMELAFDWTDDAPPAQGLYYVRVRQRDIVHGRVAMAWSSPVWVEHAAG